MDKKAQALRNFATGLIGFLGAMVLLAVVVTVMTEFVDTQNPATLTEIDNETHFANRTAAFNLTNAVAFDTANIVISNNTNLLVLNVDYLVSFNNGFAQINWTGFPNSSDNVEVGVNYTYRTGNDNYAVNATRGGQEGLLEVANLSSVMGLLLAFIVVLALLAGLTLAIK